MSNDFRDDAIVLHVKNWQTADKYAVCFTREHGKIRFIVYGGRYPKNVAGRLLQPFAQLSLEVIAGQRIDKLKSCELLEMPQAFDFKQMAYAAVVTELTAIFTEDHQPQPEVYELVKETLLLLKERNPRIVVLSFVLKLLDLVGLAPQVEACVVCGKEVAAEEDAWFSPLQGGIICNDCHNEAGEEKFSVGTRKLLANLKSLDFKNPKPFTVKGGELMELEGILYKFILFQTDKPLNSINFLSKMGI